MPKQHSMPSSASMSGKNWVIPGQLKVVPVSGLTNPKPILPAQKLTTTSSSSQNSAIPQQIFIAAATSQQPVRSAAINFRAQPSEKTIRTTNNFVVKNATKTIRLTPTQLQNVKIIPQPAQSNVVVGMASGSTTSANGQVPVVSAQSPTAFQILFQNPRTAGICKPITLAAPPPPQAVLVSTAVLPPPSVPSPSVTSTYSTNKKQRTDNNSVNSTNQRSDNDVDSNNRMASNPKRARCIEKASKGLRHFSMKVCEKVCKKGTTTYNEVADELVADFISASSDGATVEPQQYDQKNIRRRVYDALNVLMAMNIISKERKEIRWIGLPSSSLQECIQLEKEKVRKLASIQEKQKQLRELILNQIAFKNLAQRNRDNETVHGQPQPNSYIHLPFLVISANKKTEIDCSISNDKMEYVFRFNDKFEINDDLEILKAMGMLFDLNTGKCTAENVAKMKSMVPKVLEDYVTQMASGVSSIDDIVAAAATANHLDEASSSSQSTLIMEDLVETTLDDENSRLSLSDPVSSDSRDFFYNSDEVEEEDVESEMSSDFD